MRSTCLQVVLLMLFSHVFSAKKGSMMHACLSLHEFPFQGIGGHVSNCEDILCAGPLKWSGLQSQSYPDHHFKRILEAPTVFIHAFFMV